MLQGDSELKSDVFSIARYFRALFVKNHLQERGWFSGTLQVSFFELSPKNTVKAEKTTGALRSRGGFLISRYEEI